MASQQNNKQKHVVVLGAGLVGVATAYALVQDGHKVSVIDKNSEAALGASFANGGHIATGDALPWTSFDFLRRLLSGLWNKNSAATLHLRAEREQWLWLLRLLGNLSQAGWNERAGALLSLANFSQQCFEAQHSALHTIIQTKVVHRGVMHLFPPKELKKATARMALMRHYDIECHLLQGTEILKKEPALTKALQYQNIGTALFYPKDKTGDAKQWTQSLATIAKEAGVQFYFNHTIQAVQAAGQSLTSLITQEGNGVNKEIPGDVFVLALGTGSGAFAKHFGLRLPVYPVRGYSITMDTNGAHAPSMGLVDEKRRIVISRLGDKLRLAGLADIGVRAGAAEARAAILLQAWQDLIPTSSELKTAQFWSGDRPMTPDSLPLIGKSGGFENLYLNTGHGALGWTLCHGSAQLISDLIAKRAPAIDTSPFSLGRF